MRADQIKQQIATLLLQYPELEDDEVLRADMIEGETNLHEFLRTIEKRRRNTDGQLRALDYEVGELKARTERFERRKEAMKELMFRLLQAGNLRKVELPEATLSIANGQAHVVITDEAMIPDILCRIKREPDKTRIKQMLKEGTEVRGAVLSNASPHLTIRTR